MNNNVSLQNTRHNNLIKVGLLVEAIDDLGVWNPAKIVKISDNKLFLNFIDELDKVNRTLNINSDKWRFHNETIFDDYEIENDTDQYKIGDIILSKWDDNQFYLAKILDISLKTKFGKRAKEYSIIYLYDNVKDNVLETRIKTATCKDLESLNVSMKQKVVKNSKFVRKSLKTKIEKRNELNNIVNDNVLYDEKTKQFTEKCRMRRQRLSLSTEIKETEVEVIKEIVVPKPPVIPTDKIIKKPILNKSMPLPIVESVSEPRTSNRKRKCPYKNSDYFYPESFDQIFTEKSNLNQSNENSELSSQSEINVEPINNNNKILTVAEIDNKEVDTSLNVDMLSFTPEESPNKKDKVELDESNEIEESDKNLYSPTEDGKYRCLLCANKSFRKKQLVLDHLKHYHQSQLNTSPEVSPTKPKLTPKRYISNYLKNNRNSLDSKRQIKSYKSFKNINNSRSFRSESNRSFSSHLKYKTFESPLKRKKACGALTASSIHEDPVRSDIIYCHRCKRCNDDGALIQCRVCLCLSHAACYGLGQLPDHCFWECDSCVNVQPAITTATTTNCSDTNKSSSRSTRRWHRDKWRFHDLRPSDNMPSSSSGVGFSSNKQYRGLCELQSVLSACQKILDAITRNLERMEFKNPNDSNSQDELELFKSLYSNIDSLYPDTDDIFKSSFSSTSHGVHQPHPAPSSFSDTVTIKDSQVPGIIISSQPDYQFSGLHFTNSTPNKAFQTASQELEISRAKLNSSTGNVNGHKSVNTSLDGILDCDIQKLDFIPKADFDALVKDLSNCDDICKPSEGVVTTSLGCVASSAVDDDVVNSVVNTSSSFLDLIADDQLTISCCSLATTAAVTTAVHHRQQQIIGQHPADSQHPSETIIDSDLANFLSDHHRENFVPETVQLLDSNLPVNKDSIDISPYKLTRNTCSNLDFLDKLEAPCLVGIVDEVSTHEMNSSVVPPLHNQHQHDLELAAEIGAMIEDGSRPDNDEDTDETEEEDDSLLSGSMHPHLQWLLTKYRQVEHVIDCISRTIIDSASSIDRPAPTERFFRLNRYLNTLLFVLNKQDSSASASPNAADNDDDDDDIL